MTRLAAVDGALDDALGSHVGVIVLAGGQGRRFGGDKLGADLDGRPLLDHLLDDLPGSWPVVCVGPVRATRRPVVWVRERPPGGGPVAGIAAGLEAVPDGIDHVLVLAGDLPRGGAVARLLVAAHAEGPDADAVAAVEDGSTDEWPGRPPDTSAGSAGVLPNPLAVLYARAALTRALPDEPAGQPARSLLGRVTVRTVPMAAELLADVDTRDDLRAAGTPIWDEPAPGGPRK